MIRSKFTYPITVNMLRDHPEETEKLFIKKKRHKDGVFLGICFLEYDLNRAETDPIRFGERFSLHSEKENFPLWVMRENGEYIGNLSFSQSLFPSTLLRLGINVWCYVECAEYKLDVPTIIVSIYCDKY